MTSMRFSGGGGGSLGIVTSFTVRTYPAPAITTFFSTNWDLPSTAPTLTWFQNQAPNFPDELSTDYSVSSGNVQISGMYLGSKADLLGILNSMGYQALPPKKSEDVRELSYIDAALNNAVLSQGLAPANDINSLALGPGMVQTSPCWPDMYYCQTHRPIWLLALCRSMDQWLCRQRIR